MPAKDLMLVLIQFALLALFAFVPGFSFTSGFWQQTIAFVLVVSGLLLSAAAFYHLGSSLSPFPTPKQGSSLVTSGPFRYIRHPIYSGIISILLGLSVYTMDIPRLIIAFCIFLLFRIKSGYEEKLLRERFPEYERYQKTAGRFLPRIIAFRKLKTH